MCDLPTVSTTKDVTARTPHQCCECDATIHPGDHYVRVKGRWAGEWNQCNRCVDCAEAIVDYWHRPGAVAGDLEDVIEFGNAIETLEEWARDQPEAAIPDSIKRFIERVNERRVA